MSVLRELHDEIDAAVLDAYGWSDLLPLLRIAYGNDAMPVVGAPLGATASQESVGPKGPPMGRLEAKRLFDETILERLVALNTERAAEEARGVIL